VDETTVSIANNRNIQEVILRQSLQNVFLSNFSWCWKTLKVMLYIFIGGGADPPDDEAQVQAGQADVDRLCLLSLQTGTS
jgi:hypothetical protein